MHEVTHGRMYDYNNGRFLSVDPFIQSPTSTQSMNPYTYIFNNPLSGVDPTGYCATTDSIKDCGDGLGSGESEEITNEDGDVVGSVSKDKNGNKVFTDNKSGKSIAISNGSDTNKARAILGKVDNEISNLKSVVSEQRNRSGSIKYNGGSAITKESLYLGELQSKRKDLALFIKLSKSCEPNCKGTIPKELIEVFGKLTQSFGVNVAMGSMGLGGNSTIAANRTVTARTASKELVPFYPINNGFLGETTKITLKQGEIIDRFGGSGISRFFSPQGTPNFMRSLPPGTSSQPLSSFVVVKPFDVESGLIAPAFNQIGLGTQFRSNMQLGELLERGFLKRVVK